MRPRIFVDGSEGTTGLQIVERLALRADLEVLTIEAERRKDPTARAEFLNAADVAFLCLPDEAAKESVQLVTNPKTIIIDASTAHRVDPAWAYGLPELGATFRERIKTSNRIANVGCHAAAFLLGVKPLIDQGIIPASFSLSAFSITGYSGGGKKMIAAYEQPGSTVRRSPRHYALDLDHKHLPEMKLHSGLAMPPIFNPVVAAYYQGLAITVPLPLIQLPGKPNLSDLHGALSAAYRNERFIRVLPLDRKSSLDGGYFDVEACNGTNRADILLSGSANIATIIVRLDNLGKGASGSAMQCMNLRLGLDESIGLSV